MLGFPQGYALFTWVLPIYTLFFLVLLAFIGFYQFLTSFTGFYRFFSISYRVITGLTSFYLGFLSIT